MSSETERDLGVLVREYLHRTGRENNDRNFLTAVATNPAWRKRYPAWKQAESKKRQADAVAAAAAKDKLRATVPAQDQILVEQWLDFENKRREEFNSKQTSGTGLPKLEIGPQNGQINFEAALYNARQWFQDRQDAYTDAVNADLVAQQHYKNSEEARGNRVLHERYATDGIGRKFLDRYDVVEIDEAQAAYYVKQYIDVENGVQLLRDLQETQCSIAAANLGEHFSEGERARIFAFVKANNLDFVAASYEAAFQVLVAEKVIRRKPVAWPGKVSVPKPELPPVVERKPVDPVPQTRGQEQLAREKELIVELRAKMAPYIDEVSEHDAVPVSDNVVLDCYSSLMEQRAELTRGNIRRALFYSILKTGRRPAHSAFSSEEVFAFGQRSEINKIPAEIQKRMLQQYGEVSLRYLTQAEREKLGVQ